MITNCTDAYVVFTMENGYLAQNKELIVNKSEWTYNSSNGRYYAMFPTVCACEMGDDISAVLYVVDADGTVRYSNADVYSVEDYGYAAINAYKPSANATTKNKSYYMVRLAIELLNYGSAAQIAFGYEADQLVNRNLSAEDVATYCTDICDYTNYRSYGNNNLQVVFKATSLNLKEKINSEIKIDISNLTGATKDDLTGVVTDATTGEVLQVIPASEFIAISGTTKQWYMDITALKSTQMRQLISITVYTGYGTDAQTAVSTTCTYSVESYVAIANAASTVAANMKALVTATLKYGDAADAYFNFS